MQEKILVTGALGQIGTELVLKLREIYGEENVIASDLRDKSQVEDVNYEKLDVTDVKAIHRLLKEKEIDIVYHLAAMLSATAEKFPHKAWDLNMGSLLTFLEAAKEKEIRQLYWPSSIAVFGPNTPKIDTKQDAIAIPVTVYGISKVAGELWCDYYNQKFGVDVRSLRYPGLISWKTLPGGGTTDYAVDIFYKALEEGKYECFLKEDTALPMMYMDDAIRATIQIMQADPKDLSIHTSYNLNALSFTPKELAEEIQKELPEFEITYNPDERQGIADTWPASIDDSVARRDWGWQPKFTLDKMTRTMLENLKNKLEVKI